MKDQQNQPWNLERAEGKLAMDVFRKNDHIVIRAMVAGVNMEDLDISVQGDLLTIRGNRQHAETLNDEDWFYRECYWGAFSRSLILPIDVQPEKAKALLKEGVLTISIPLQTDRIRLSITPVL